MKRWEELLSRRNFIKLTASSGTAFLLSTQYSSPGFSKAKRKPSQSSFNDQPELSSEARDFLVKYGPIDRSLSHIAPSQFFGDNNQRPHKILWNLPKSLEKKKRLDKTEKASVVIIGGGLAGLFSAYNLRKYNPIIIEQAPRFGGNAKGQSWKGLDYAIGSAYIDTPHPGTPMEAYYKELNLDELLVKRTAADPVEYQGQLYTDFWEGGSDKREKEKYEKIAQFFQALTQEKERPFPFIPSLNENQLTSLKHYDQWDLHTLLSKIAGGTLPSQLEAAIEHYCWSTYAASAKEISASAALNFLAQEVNPILIASGGNSKIGDKKFKAVFAGGEQVMSSLEHAKPRGFCLLNSKQSTFGR